MNPNPNPTLSLTLALALTLTRAPQILEFIRSFTVYVEGVGHVCGFALFDFERHGDSRYGAPVSGEADQRSCDGKMEKAYLSFRANHPSWRDDTLQVRVRVWLTLTQSLTLALALTLTRGPSCSARSAATAAPRPCTSPPPPPPPPRAPPAPPRALAC